MLHQYRGTPWNIHPTWGVSAARRVSAYESFQNRPRSTRRYALHLIDPNPGIPVPAKIGNRSPSILEAVLSETPIFSAPTCRELLPISVAPTAVHSAVPT